MSSIKILSPAYDGRSGSAPSLALLTAGDGPHLCDSYQRESHEAPAERNGRLLRIKTNVATMLETLCCVHEPPVLDAVSSSALV
jgi:hypothetical protein